MNTFKEKMSKLEQFAQRHLIEVLTWAAVILAVFSSWAGVFIGTLGWSLVCMMIGAGLGVFLPVQMDRVMKKIYGFSRSYKQMTPVIAEVVKLAIALFLPFLYLGFFGVMAGTAYQYYIRYVKEYNHKKGDRAA